MAQNITMQKPNLMPTQTVLQNIMNGVIITDHTGVISVFNAACEKMFGYDSNTMFGQNIRDLIPQLFTHNDRSTFQPDLEGIREFNVRGQNGDYVPISLTVNQAIETTDISYVIIIHDMRKRKTFEEAIASNETKLLAMYASSPAACMSFDLETMKILDCNPATAEMFCTTREAFIGLTPADFSPEFQDDGRLSAEAAIEEIQKTVREGKNHFFWNHTRLTGENFPCEINTCVRELDNRAIFIASVRDMTEQKAAEKELRVAKQEAEDANVLKSRLLANISHEIRTPLNGIVGLSDAIMRYAETPELRKSLSIIKDCGHDLNVLVDDILTLSKIEADGLDLELVDVDVKGLLKAINQLWQEKAAERGNTFELIVKDGFPDSLELDPVRVRQCINNLVANAIKFTKNGRVQVIADLAKTPKGTFLTIKVADTGCGMTAEQLAIIFKPFTQADSSITRQYGGTGLGLSIVKSLTEKMGGGVRVKSRLGQGSAFILAIKVAVPDVVSIPQPKIKVLRKDPLSGLDILFAEDNDINAYVLKALLEPLGVTLTRAINGREAVKQAALKQFDLVLMDIQMPIMTGVEACLEIKSSNFPSKSTPIIALTANVMPKYQAEYLSVGMVSICSKPYNVEQLKGAILNALRIEMAA